MKELREVFWRGVRWFLFKLDPEFAHRLTLRFIRLGIFLGNVPLRIVSGAESETEKAPTHSVFGIEFQSCLGLAAGFDKNAEILTALPALGFGFAEIGTVTPRPQPRNSRPRLFRDAPRGALFNRMGFNNLGAEVISKRLIHAKSVLPAGFRVGVNVGKNKDTPLESAWEDYVRAARPFEGLADYLVINVSSPNTPGLRSLQTIEALKPIIGEVANLLSGWRSKPPLLVKVAPEMNGLELVHLVQTAEPWGVDGWVLTNTLGGTLKVGSQELTGGWSGKPLAELALRSLVEVRAATRRPIISVGGIFSPLDALGSAFCRGFVDTDLHIMGFSRSFVSCGSF